MRNKFKKFLIVAVTALSQPQLFAATPNANNASLDTATKLTKKLDIEKLQHTLLNEGVQQLYNYIELGLRQQRPNMPPSQQIWASFNLEKQRYIQASGQKYVNYVTAYVQKNFSETEARSLIAFYDTPTGSKLNKMLGETIISESARRLILKDYEAFSKFAYAHALKISVK